MADLSKIKLNGTEYNLKDAEAREAIPTKISELTNDSGYAFNSSIGIGYMPNASSIYIPKIPSGVTDSYGAYYRALIYVMGDFTTSQTYLYYIGGTNAITDYPNKYQIKKGIYFFSGRKNGDSYTLDEIATTSILNTAIGNINSFEVAIVTTLPTENIDTHTIYFMANNNNAYDEYMYINNNWELIGSSNIDLSGYMETSHAANSITSAKIDTWDKASSLWNVSSDKENQENHYWWNLTIQQSGLYNYSNSPGSRGALRYIKIPAYNDGATTNIQLEVPTHSGKIALTSQIPTIPTNISAFTNDSGYLTTAPVTSVNGQTGDITLSIPAATTVTNTLSTGTRIATINGTDILAPESGSSISEETDPVYSASPAATITTEKITAWDAKSDFSGSYNDLSDKPTIPTVPTNISAFTNDSGYLTSFTETDPTVPAWAKAETKPAYTAAEVGAMATTHAANAITSTDISNWNSKTSNTGTVTSVRVQATSPVQSSTSTAQTTTLNTTISLVNGYGDTKNPYGTKTANYVLAGPASGNAAAPGFRKLVAADIPAIGNITNAGDITTTATIASGDRLVINDESASKVINSSITFGSSTTQYLANNGTWQNAYDDTALAARVTALENLEWATYYSGRSNPSNSQGQNGDIYLQY